MFIVLECFGGSEFTIIVTDIVTGDNLSFKTRKDAQIEADKCQKGIVVQISNF